MLKWADVQPVAEATYELLDESSDNVVDGAAVAERLGTEDDDLSRLRNKLRVLEETDYIRAYFPGGAGPPQLIQPTEKGLQATMNWPKPGEMPDATVLLNLLDERIADPNTPEEERTKLERLRTSASEVSKAALGQVLAALFKHTAGI